MTGKTGGTVAKIRHIAIATHDPEATAQFYKDGLGLQDAGRVANDLAEGYYLTDGYINLAILKFKDDFAAATEGAPRYTGVHHIGFQVDDMTSAEGQIIQAGASYRSEGDKPGQRAEHSANVEVKFVGPDGVTVDLSQTGWSGTD
ncbi:MAG: Catechol 2,3-dioxygenase [Chloroflexi bacterium]|nr:MAG: Catechol 2,3-dioxygenase [Chloroflexota bacterium]